MSSEFAALLGPNEVRVDRDLAAPAERRTLVDWVIEQRRNGRLLQNPQDAGALSTPFRAGDGALTRMDGLLALRASGPGPLVWVPDPGLGSAPLPDEAWRIRQRVIDELGLHAFDDDPYKGTFISVIDPGSGVHQHRDERLVVAGQARPILRCNLFLRKAGAGGDPVFDGRLRLEVPEGGMWAFYPTELVHSATTVQGASARILLSMGFLGRETQWLRRRFAVSTAFAATLATAAAQGDEDVPPEGGGAGLPVGVAQALRAAGIEQDRLAVLAYALARGPVGFDACEAADSLRIDPATRVNAIVLQLQRAGLLASRSSAPRYRSQAWVL